MIAKELKERVDGLSIKERAELASYLLKPPPRFASSPEIEATRERLRDAKQRGAPFTIELRDGRTFDVASGEYIWVIPGPTRAFWVWEQTEEEEEPPSHHLSLAEVADIVEHAEARSFTTSRCS